MRVRVTMPTADGKRLREKILEGAEKVEDDEMGNEDWEVVSILIRVRTPVPIMGTDSSPRLC